MIISDSFLRSYSLSRIVKINEEYRNRAKIFILRKVKKMKQQQQKRQFQNNQKELMKIQEVQDHEEGTNLLSVNSPQQKLFKISKKKHQIYKKQESIKNQQASPKQQTQPKQQPQKVFRQLRLNHSQINFNEDKSKQNSYRLQNALKAFKKLKLLDYKDNQKLIQHFCRRNLQSYSVDQLKELAQIEKSKQKQSKKFQLQPIRFGKNNYSQFKDKEKEKDKSKTQKNNNSIINKQNRRSQTRNSVSLHQSQNLKAEFENKQIFRNLCDNNNSTISNNRNQKNINFSAEDKLSPDKNNIGCKTNYLWEGKKFNSLNARDIGKMLNVKLKQQKNIILNGKHRRQQSQELNKIQEIKLFKFQNKNQ